MRIHRKNAFNHTGCQTYRLRGNKLKIDSKLRIIWLRGSLVGNRYLLDKALRGRELDDVVYDELGHDKEQVQEHDKVREQDVRELDEEQLQGHDKGRGQDGQVLDGELRQERGKGRGQGRGKEQGLGHGMGRVQEHDKELGLGHGMG